MLPKKVIKKFILAIDQGTTGSRAFLFDHLGRPLSSAYQEFKHYYPKPGWVEHDAMEIWASIENVIRKTLASSKIDPSGIAAIGITNQRETTLLWDRRTGKPCHRAIVWQCRRTADICSKLKPHANLFTNKTGLRLDPYFSGTKVRWLLDNVKGLRVKAERGEIAFGTMDSWLMYQLSGGKIHATDMTNASRTLMFDIERRGWSPDLLKLLKVPAGILPEVKSSSALFGVTAASVAGLPAGIPITGVMGDQQAALYGQGCTRPGSIKNTYGTGCFMLLNTGGKRVHSRRGLLTTLACDAKGEPVFALEGAVFIAGAVIQWLRDELGVIKNSSDSEAFIAGLKDTCGVYVVPAFAGLGAPYWEPNVRGAVTGLTRGANVRHIVRAALESMAYQTKDIFDLMQQESGLRVKDLAVDGGACRNDFLMQFQADLLGVRLMRPRMVDTTVKGAAFLAGVSIGLYAPSQIFAPLAAECVFTPAILRAKASALYAGWTKAVGQVLAGKAE